MLVLKFGGTSLADSEAISRACRITRDRAGGGALVVVSAMGQTTDQLSLCAQGGPANACRLLQALRDDALATAGSLLGSAERDELAAAVDRIFGGANALVRRLSSPGGPPTPSADLDALLACGERVSSWIVTLALRRRGVDAVRLDSRALFVTESRHGGAAADFDRTKVRLLSAALPLVRNGRVPVMGGFIARDAYGEATTLGRGGSDYSAALAGAALAASEVQIWTDVDGVMTADPSLIPSARSLPVLSLREASELAYFGGRVLHPSTMLPAIRHGIPIRVLNSMRPHGSGTLIVPAAPEAPQVVKSVVYKENITLIDIHSTRMLMAHGFLARIFAVFERHETAVDMVSTSEVSVSLTVDRPDKVPAVLDDLASFSHAEENGGKAIVCVVGEGIRYTPGIAAKVFDALEGIRIRMISLGASRVNIGFVVDEGDLEACVRRLHATFFEQPASSGGESCE